MSPLEVLVKAVENLNYSLQISQRDIEIYNFDGSLVHHDTHHGYDHAVQKIIEELLVRVKR